MLFTVWSATGSGLVQTTGGPVPTPDASGPVPTPDASGPRVAMRVLVVTDGTPSVEAIRQQLKSEGVAIRVVDLKDPSRTTITGAFLSGRLADGTPEGYYQGVVLPGNQVPGLSSDEQAALAGYERAFSVRQVDAFAYPSRDVGMSPPTYAGTLDAATVTVTRAARSSAFQYLSGSFTFQGAAGGDGSYGYLSRPLPDTGTTKFTPFLTATVRDSGPTGVLAGVYTDVGRQRLAVSFGFNERQLQFRYLAHGMVSWLTKGVHLGHWRNYFSVHIDDVFNANARWSTVGNCTPGEGGCPPGTPDTTPIRMTEDDVHYAARWQREHNFTMDMVFNGGAEARFRVNGEDPMFTAFQSLATEFRWVNHTYTHPFLGCVQDFTVIPWRCKTDANGNIVWVDSNTIDSQILDNIKWAKANKFPINRGELLTGEHSGMRLLPQQPVDNPNLVKALGKNKIQYVALDASRDPALRPVGAALGAPRHPINVFYNVATEAEEVDEFNWFYTSSADGGSGSCEKSTPARCIKPLDPSTGWSSYLAPEHIRTTLGDVLHNDPRTFYMHQSNLAGDRLAYPVMGGVLSAYRSVFAPNTPVVNARFSAAAEVLNQQQTWAKILDTATVSGYVQGNTLTLTGPAGMQVPVTVPDQSRLDRAVFGEPYGGERSAHTTLGASPTTLVLPFKPYPATRASAAATATPSPRAASTSDGDRHTGGMGR